MSSQGNKSLNSSQRSFKPLGKSRMDTNVLKNTFQEFTQKAKERLVKLKNEISLITEDNKQKENQEKEQKIKLDKLKGLEKNLDDRLEMAKEQLLQLQKEESTYSKEKKALMASVKQAKNDIYYKQIDNTHKMEQILKQTGKYSEIRLITEKEIERRIEVEYEKREKMQKAVALLNEDIETMRRLIDNIDGSANKRNKVIDKETADMQKFLSEI